MLGKRLSVAFWAIALVGGCVMPAWGAGLPSGWTNKDIGAPTRPGSTTFDEAKGTWTVTGEGNDIWGADTDNFQYAYTQLKGDGNITARLLSQTGGHDDGWGRNGLMIREDETAGARHLDFVLGCPDLTPTNANSQSVFYSYFRPDPGSDQMTWCRTLGNVPQYDGQAANRGAAGLRELPMWVRIQRQGNLLTAYTSPDGKVWSSQISPQALGATPLPDTMLVGMAVCAHDPDADTGDLSTTVFDNVTVNNDLLGAWPSGVDAIASRTDNRVLVTWLGRPNATGYTIYRQAVGEQQYTKAGTSDSATWFIDAGADGNGLTAGTNYRYVVTATVDGKETAASYRALVTPGAIPSAIGSFLSYDVGTSRAGSTTIDSNGVLTITASGLDIWNAGDGFRFVGTTHEGSISMTAKLLEKPTSANTDGWVKAGLMVRESLDPASRNAIITATTNDAGDHAGTNFSWRKHFNNTGDESNATQDGLAAGDVKFPMWLRIKRNRDQIEGFTSNDGTNFTKVGGDDGGVTLDRLAARIYVGFCVTNHRDGDFATAKFDANSITFQ